MKNTYVVRYQNVVYKLRAKITLIGPAFQSFDNTINQHGKQVGTFDVWVVHHFTPKYREERSSNFNAVQHDFASG